MALALVPARLGRSPRNGAAAAPPQGDVRGFSPSLNQVTGPIARDAMSIGLLGVIDGSRGADENIIKIAFVAIYIFSYMVTGIGPAAGE